MTGLNLACKSGSLDVSDLAVAALRSLASTDFDIRASDKINIVVKISISYPCTRAETLYQNVNVFQHQGGPATLPRDGQPSRRGAQ